MRAIRPILLASTAATVLVAAACSRDASAPVGPTIAGAPSVSPFFTAATDTTSSDSVIAGYGCHATGGLEYECFEYEPCTGTEYVVCPDTTGSSDPEPTPTGPTAPKSTSGSTTTQDSVTSGYGSGSTGGLEYDRFEYDPETGTEPVVTDTTPKPKTTN